METNSNIETLRKRTSILLTTLKPHEKQKDVYTTTINFCGYTSLICTIADIMKLCTLAMDSDEPHVASYIEAGRIDLIGIMELALQLMPYNEAEFLDVSRDILSRPEPPQPEPNYNYSTIIILKSKTRNPQKPN